MHTTKNKILESALIEYSLRGYSRLTIANVLERSKISRPTFYLHFSNKEDLITSALTSHSINLKNAMYQASLDDEDFNIKSHNRLKVFFQWWDENEALGLRVMHEIGDHSLPINAVHEKFITMIAEYWQGQFDLMSLNIKVDILEIYAILSMTERLCSRFLNLEKSVRKLEIERYINCAQFLMSSYIKNKFSNLNTSHALL